MGWPRHLDGVPPSGHDLLSDALDGVRKEQKEARRFFELAVAGFVEAASGVYALEVEELPGRVGELLQGSLEFEAVDLFDASANAKVLAVDVDRNMVFARFWRGRPRKGRCRAHPFDYLESMRTVYERAALGAGLAPALERALSAVIGDLPPRRSFEGTPFDALFRQAWGTLWGPPGTGKTTTLARELAARAEQGRALFVSTTNQATDLAALRFGAAVRERGGEACLGRRLGSGASARSFAEAGLEEMFGSQSQGVRGELAAIEEALVRETAPEEIARLHVEALALRGRLSASVAELLDESSQVVFTTIHSAAKLLAGELRPRLEAGEWPFETLVIDEAGQVPRAMVAMLSLLARERVLLAGDPRQLAPISRAARVFAPSVKRFLAQSALDGLTLPSGTEAPDPAVLLLAVQYRSNAEVGALISRYQYEGRLATAESAGARLPEVPGLPATALVLLDEEPEARRDPSRAHAERPRGGRGWERPLTVLSLGRLFDANEGLAGLDGLLLSPFVAQLALFEAFIAERGLEGRFRASTVHAQQGSEADVVIFDSVHAGATAWDEVEWRRLINVGLSRARRCALLFASRSELRQPFLLPLVSLMRPHRLLRGRLVPLASEGLGLDAARPAYGALSSRLPGRVGPAAPAGALALPSLRAPAGGVAERAERYAPAQVRTAYRLGEQIGLRRRLRPVLGHEQDRLCRLKLDEGPRLVRGVAGSGKTLVAVHWAVRSLLEAPPDARLLFVYGNQALEPLLRRSLAEVAAGLGLAFPDPRLELRHAGDFLKERLQGLRFDRWQYEDIAAALGAADIEPTHDALFVDEAQDFGEAALRQLLRFVRARTDGGGGEVARKAVRIFYDDAQEVYGRTRPHWASLGLDLRGRSVVMRESFRSTRAVGELALNTLAELEGGLGLGLAELCDDQLVELERVGEHEVLRSLHHLFDGPAPVTTMHARRSDEWAWVAGWVRRSVVDQGVCPADVKVLAMGLSPKERAALTASLQGSLGRAAGVEVLRRGEGPSDVTNAVEVLTPHAMKGYEAELVFVVGADRFQSSDEPMPRVLYTAMTRARSLLFVSGTRGDSAAGDAVLDGIDRVRRRL